jgi:hypothetical protein
MPEVINIDDSDYGGRRTFMDLFQQFSRIFVKPAVEGRSIDKEQNDEFFLLTFKNPPIIPKRYFNPVN